VTYETWTPKQLRLEVRERGLWAGRSRESMITALRLADGDDAALAALDVLDDAPAVTGGLTATAYDGRFGAAVLS
jgi:hypothetical protein